VGPTWQCFFEKENNLAIPGPSTLAPGLNEPDMDYGPFVLVRICFFSTSRKNISIKLSFGLNKAGLANSFELARQWFGSTQLDSACWDC
jgi:hypothetical protein